MVDAKLDHTILKDLSAEEEQAVEKFIYRLGSENAFGDGIAVSEDEAIKFLMARKFDVGRAISLYHTHRMLRGRFELEHLEPNNEPLYGELQSGKFTVSSAKGPDGDTLCIFYARRHFPKLVDHITVLQSIVFQLDSIMKKSDAQRQGLSLLYDMTSSGYSNFDFDLAMKVLHLLKGGYPARLKHVYIIAAPFWFRASMAILTNFLREKIKDRVEVVKTFPELYHRIPRECLPRELGGNVDHNHKDWLDECMNHFHISISSLNLTEQISENEKAEIESRGSIPSIQLDSREIFENAENHEQQKPTAHENHDTIPNSEPPIITDQVSEPPDIPPPLPPRPPRRSPQPSPQTMQKFANRALPPEPPQEAVPAFENSISDTDSLSERSSQGRQPFTLDELIEYMATVGEQGIHKEYEELRSLPPPGTFESTLYPINTKKNRYNNILTFEETRVKLKRIDQDPFSDYINANYVNGYSIPKKFICTQGPTPYTFNDFWRMIWEQKVGIIVMVTRCVERNRVKCGEYWPRLPEEAKQYGHIVVANIGQDEFKDFTTTRFEIFNLQTDQTRYAYHIQFTTWPDFGVLQSATPILDVIQFIESQQKLIAEHLKLEEAEKPTTNGKAGQELEGSGEYASPVYTNSSEYANSGDYTNLEHTESGEYASLACSDDKTTENPYPPVVIHCSAGVGRSGTFCCISNAVERLQKTGTTDIYSTVKSIREQRAFSIQTPDQYEFCYRGILKYAARSKYEIREDLFGIVNQLLNLDAEDSSDSENDD